MNRDIRAERPEDRGQRLAFADPAFNFAGFEFGPARRR